MVYRMSRMEDVDLHISILYNTSHHGNHTKYLPFGIRTDVILIYTTRSDVKATTMMSGLVNFL